MRERERSQPASCAEVEPAGVGGSHHVAVPCRIHDDRHRWVIFCGGADHCWAANVDLLDDVVLGRAGPHRVDEGVQVHDHQVERFHLKLAELLDVVIAAPVGEDSRMYTGVECLDPAVEAFLETGELRNFRDGDASRGNALRSGPGGDDTDAGAVQARGQFLQPRLVVHRDQGPADGNLVKMVQSHAVAPGFLLRVGSTSF